MATFAAAAIVVLLAILFIGWLPATRAVKVDPMVALRYEQAYSSAITENYSHLSVPVRIVLLVRA